MKQSVTKILKCGFTLVFGCWCLIDQILHKDKKKTKKQSTEIIVLQQVEVAHLLSHGDLLHSALVQVELLSYINVTVQNTTHCHLNAVVNIFWDSEGVAKHVGRVQYRQQVYATLRDTIFI